MARLLERVYRAALRIDARQNVLDGTVLAGGVDALQDHENSPAPFRVKPFLEIGEFLDANLQDLLAALLFEIDIADVAGIEVLELELVTIGDAKPLDDLGWQHGPPLLSFSTAAPLEQSELKRLLDAGFVVTRIVDLRVHFDRFEQIVGGGLDHGKRFLRAHCLAVEPCLEALRL